MYYNHPTNIFVPCWNHVWGFNYMICTLTLVIRNCVFEFDLTFNALINFLLSPRVSQPTPLKRISSRDWMNETGTEIDVPEVELRKPGKCWLRWSSISQVSSSSVWWVHWILNISTTFRRVPLSFLSKILREYSIYKRSGSTEISCYSIQDENGQGWPIRSLARPTIARPMGHWVGLKWEIVHLEPKPIDPMGG